MKKARLIVFLPYPLFNFLLFVSFIVIEIVKIFIGFFHPLLCCLLVHDEERRERVLRVGGELREEKTFQHVVGTLGAHHL